MENKRIRNRAFSRIGIGYGAFLFASLLLQLELVAVIGILSEIGIEVEFGNGFMVLVSTLTYGFGGLLVYVIVKDMPVSAKPRKKKGDAGLLTGAFLVSISTLYLGNIIGLTLMYSVSTLQGKPMINPVEETIEGLSLWAIFITMVVMAPVCEELLFRKIIIDRVRQFGDKAAILVSAVLFGLSHGNFYQFFYAFGIGLVFAYIYIQTGKVGYTILFHGLINFLGSVVALAVIDNPWFAAAYSIFMLVSVVLGIIIFVKNRRNLRLWPGAEGSVPLVPVWTALANPGMLVFFLGAVILFVISGTG